MNNVNEIIAAIEAIETERNNAVEEVNKLRIEVWELKQQLDIANSEIQKWKNIVVAKN